MKADTHRGRGHSQPTFAELFTPKLVTVLREGYRLPQFQADLMAGLTVAIVALPLSMAIAISSGVSPDRGLFTAVIGGFLISALGGSRFQIGGPAGAFIVLVAATVERHGVDGLLLATLIAGGFLMAMGRRLGQGCTGPARQGNPLSPAQAAATNKQKNHVTLRPAVSSCRERSVPMRFLLLLLGVYAAANGSVMLAAPYFWYVTVPGVTDTGPPMSTSSATSVLPFSQRARRC
jgi:hypothetical protein